MAQILTISSRVIRGTVGNTLSAFLLQRIGHTVWDVPTVIWDHHPGFGRPSGLTLTGAQVATLLADFAEPEQARRTHLVLSGYCAAAEQIEAIAAHVEALRTLGVRAPFCCDPVCGDAPGLYVGPEVLRAMRDRLVPLADVLTPNRHELGFLTGMPVTSNAEIIAAARALERPLCLVTSAFGGSADQIGNLLVAPQQAWLCTLPRAAQAPNGTGDLLTALFAGWLAAGIIPQMAMARATAGVRAALEATSDAGARELAIVAAQDAIVSAADAPLVTDLPSDGVAAARAPQRP